MALSATLQKKILNMAGLEAFATKVKTYVTSAVAEVNKKWVALSVSEASTAPEIKISSYTEQGAYITCGTLTQLTIDNTTTSDKEVTVYFTASSTAWNGLTFKATYKVIDEIDIEAGETYELSIRNNIMVLAEINTVTVS